MSCLASGPQCIDSKSEGGYQQHSLSTIVSATNLDQPQGLIVYKQVNTTSKQGNLRSETAYIYIYSSMRVIPLYCHTLYLMVSICRFTQILQQGWLQQNTQICRRGNTVFPFPVRFIIHIKCTLLCEQKTGLLPNFITYYLTSLIFLFKEGSAIFCLLIRQKWKVPSGIIDNISVFREQIASARSVLELVPLNQDLDLPLYVPAGMDGSLIRGSLVFLALQVIKHAQVSQSLLAACVVQLSAQGLLIGSQHDHDITWYRIFAFKTSKPKLQLLSHNCFCQKYFFTLITQQFDMVAGDCPPFIPH